MSLNLTYKIMEPERPLFATIKTYGITAYKEATQLCEVQEKLAIVREQLEFNSLCKRNKILPHSLRIQPPIKNQDAHNVSRAIGFKFLNCFINDNHLRINKYNETIRQLSTSLERTLDIELWRNLLSAAQHKMRAKKNLVKHDLKNKFVKLKTEYRRNSSDVTSTCHNVINLSNRDLTSDELNVLSKGLNFALDHTQKDKINFIAAIESNISSNRDINNNDKLIVSSQVVNAIKTAKNVDNISFAEKTALNQLKNDENIITVPADKGRSTVVMNKSDYVNKCMEHLNDRNIYKVLTKNTMKSIQTRLNKVLKKLETQKKLTRSQYLNLYSNSAKIPRFYGLPKIHKQDIPIRPIVSFCGPRLMKLLKCFKKF